MATVLDVAAYILKRHGSMTAMKLQKLVYYSQAWSLVWDDAPLFAQPIQAWANGPVSPDLYREHKGRFELSPGDIPGKPETITAAQQETIDIVLRDYGDKPAQWLSDLTHMEAPWVDAWGGRSFNDRCEEEISHSAMHEYYSRVLYAEKDES